MHSCFTAVGPGVETQSQVHSFEEKVWTYAKSNQGWK